MLEEPSACAVRGKVALEQDLEVWRAYRPLESSLDCSLRHVLDQEMHAKALSQVWENKLYWQNPVLVEGLDL